MAKLVKNTKLASEFPRTNQGATVNTFPEGSSTKHDSEDKKPYGGKPQGNNAKPMGGKKKGGY